MLRFSDCVLINYCKLYRTRHKAMTFLSSRINYSDKINLTVTILTQLRYNNIIIGHFYKIKLNNNR